RIKQHPTRQRGVNSGRKAGKWKRMYQERKNNQIHAHNHSSIKGIVFQVESSSIQPDKEE
ncbi:hypothetical protein, partial [Salmonella enterica]|uniref:hypothetical protein n=1 Tax=Salmonella enterica TaxID=28901 RepID=UPI002609BF40